MDNLDVIAEFRTECGLVSANNIFEKFAKCIVHNERPAVSKIMSWRDSRTDLSIQTIAKDSAESPAVSNVKTAAALEEE